MPKPNKKRIESRQDPNNRLKGAGKLYIPDGLTTDPVERPALKPITDDELERELTKLLSGQRGYGKNYGRSLRPRPIKD